jgi:hypothetical protein
MITEGELKPTDKHYSKLPALEELDEYGEELEGDEAWSNE